MAVFAVILFILIQSPWTEATKGSRSDLTAETPQNLSNESGSNVQDKKTTILHASNDLSSTNAPTITATLTKQAAAIFRDDKTETGNKASKTQESVDRGSTTMFGLKVTDIQRATSAGTEQPSLDKVTQLLQQLTQGIFSTFETRVRHHLGRFLNNLKSTIARTEKPIPGNRDIMTLTSTTTASDVQRSRSVTDLPTYRQNISTQNVGNNATTLTKPLPNPSTNTTTKVNGSLSNTNHTLTNMNPPEMNENSATTIKDAKKTAAWVLLPISLAALSILGVIICRKNTRSTRNMRGVMFCGRNSSGGQRSSTVEEAAIFEL